MIFDSCSRKLNLYVVYVQGFLLLLLDSFNSYLSADKNVIITFILQWILHQAKPTVGGRIILRSKKNYQAENRLLQK